MIRSREREKVRGGRSKVCGPAVKLDVPEAGDTGPEEVVRRFSINVRGPETFFHRAGHATFPPGEKEKENMTSSPKKNLVRIKRVLGSWATLSPEKTFGGMTLAQFQAALQPCFEARDELRALESTFTSALNRRDDADAAALALIQRVVSGVRADPSEGDDGGLYDAMGYVRRSVRRSGLHRRAHLPPPPAPAQ